MFVKEDIPQSQEVDSGILAREASNTSCDIKGKKCASDNAEMLNSKGNPPEMSHKKTQSIPLSPTLFYNENPATSANKELISTQDVDEPMKKLSHQ